MAVYSLACLLLIAAVAISSSSAEPKSLQRIIGGSVTSITNHPYASALLYSPNFQTFIQSCGGSILTTNAILTAAHCFDGDTVNNWRIRVGSTNANSGGVLHNVRQIIIHGFYNRVTFDSDVALLRTFNTIVYNANVRAISIAGASYNILDNQPLSTVGWGAIQFNGPSSEQLRVVQFWYINQNICRNNYATIGLTVTNNMFCSGWLNVGGRDQCQGDSGGPVIANNVLVGISSWGYQCGLANYPGVNTRVSNFSSWIQNAAR